MTGHDHPLPAQSTLRSAPEIPSTNSVPSRVADWLATAADYCTAAAVYEQLSRLSDAELQRRGFSRATLASEICQACDRSPWRLTANERGAAQFADLPES